MAKLTVAARPYEVRDTECRGFCVRVEPTGTKTFWLTFSAAKLGGKRGQRLFLGNADSRSVDSVRTDAVAAKGMLAKGVDPRAERKAERASADRRRLSTLRAYLDDKYSAWAMVNLKNAEVELRRVRSDFEHWLDTPLESIDEDAASQLQRQWLANGLKRSTINRDLVRLSGVMTQAVADGRLDRHPWKNATPGRAVFKQLKTDKRKVPRFLSPTEDVALREALVKRETRMREERRTFNAWREERGMTALPDYGFYVDYLRPMLLLDLNTGLRKGELFNLHRDDVNLAAGVLTVQGDEDDDGTGSKSGHSRVIPLNIEAASVLTAWLDQQQQIDSDLVFPNPQTRERLNNIDKAWRKVRKDARLPTKVQLRHIRNTFASRLVQRGVPLFTVKELLGHADLSTTEIYAALAPGNFKSAVALLDATAERTEP